MRQGLEVADIFRRHGADYRFDHDGHLGRTERRIMAAVEACRTSSLGGHAESCGDCGLVRLAFNSCRDRHCPKCQGLARAQWLADRQAELLPVEYFHVVFTLPAEVAEIAFQNKAAVYAILFKSASEALRIIAADPRHLGAEVGAVAVLHTWGQTLHHHPHVHCIVPGGGLSPDGQRWVWNVYSKPPFGGPEQVLAYLGRYTHRVAIANSRLVGLDQGQVTFRWRDYRHHNKSKLMTLSAGEFIRRFLVHALPDRFHRIRHYGFLANGHRAAKLALCRRILQAPTPDKPVPPADYRERYRCLTGHSLDVCPACGGAMIQLGPIPRAAHKQARWPDTS